jgi:hypothetical protein
MGSGVGVQGRGMVGGLMRVMVEVVNSVRMGFSEVVAGTSWMVV